MQSRARQLLAAAVLCGASVASVAGCARDSAGPERGIDLEWVAQGDASILGETATISGEVIEVLDPRVLRLGDPDNAEGQVLVLSGAVTFEDLGLHVDEGLVGDTVEVTGAIRELDVAGFENEFDWEDAGVTLAEELEGEHVVVAEEVSTAA